MVEIEDNIRKVLIPIYRKGLVDMMWIGTVTDMAPMLSLVFLDLLATAVTLYWTLA